MICEGDPMQISSASLLTAQQVPAQPRAVQAKAPGAEEFEPLLFAAKADAPAVKPDAALVPRQANPGPISRPGSQIDIKV
jgi:hypothetical protein